MSIILDALRRTRPRTTPQAANAAQTDAVLQTLGYGRRFSNSPYKRARRLVAYVVVGIITATLLWGTVIWATQRYLVSRPAPATQPARPASN